MQPSQRSAHKRVAGKAKSMVAAAQVVGALSGPQQLAVSQALDDTGVRLGPGPLALRVRMAYGMFDTRGRCARRLSSFSFDMLITAIARRSNGGRHARLGTAIIIIMEHPCIGVCAAHGACMPVPGSTCADKPVRRHVHTTSTGL